MDADAIVTIACFLAGQTVSLIGFAGAVAWAVRNHEKRITRLEDNERNTAIMAAEIKGEVGS